MGVLRLSGMGARIDSVGIVQYCLWHASFDSLCNFDPTFSCTNTCELSSCDSHCTITEGVCCQSLWSPHWLDARVRKSQQGNAVETQGFSESGESCGL